MTSVCNGEILNIDINLVPRSTCLRNGEEPRESEVHTTGNKDTGEIVNVVDVFRADRDFATHSTGEADDVDQDTADVGGIGAPRETASVVVAVCFAGAVERVDVQVALSDDVVVTDHDTGNGGEEEGVG